MIAIKSKFGEQVVHQKASSIQVPSGCGILMLRLYRDVLPRVHNYLELWKKEAEQIPDIELRQQAVLSIKSKTFHCEGGSIYGLLAKENIKPTVRFIVACQTISDYLDNLCDRSTSIDPEDFRSLHQACLDALKPNAKYSDRKCLAGDRFQAHPP
jgi:tetraprenyl-beta-curcumene synthase